MADHAAVRAEDAFDVSAMNTWLQRNMTDPPAGEPHVEQYQKGASNRTYLLRYPGRDLVLRRPPRGRTAASAHDMAREVHVITRIRDQFPAVPLVYSLCTDKAIIGSTFYVMERLAGETLHADTNLADLAGVTPRIGEIYVDQWIALHGLDIARAGLTDWGRGPGYVRRQVEGWSSRFRRAHTEDVPDASSIMSWLDLKQPPDTGYCLIHGDWRLDNMVFRLPPREPTPTLVGVLDWEMATLGDPLMDLGSAMAYWINADDADLDPAFAQFKMQPSDAPGMPTRQEIVDRYLTRTDQHVDWTFYEVFGLFRLSVIVQQIWSRYRSGATTNPAFAHFGKAVEVLLDRATRARYGR